MNSEHIVKFIDTFETGKNYYVVQELCDCDLSKKIVKRKFLPEEECIGILTQICRGFLVLHKEGIIHRYLLLKLEI